MIKPCGSCRRKFKEEELQMKGGDLLCPKCRHQWRMHRDSKMDSAPDVLKRTTTPEGEVVVVGKDVPFGYQEDPEIILEKLDREEKEKWLGSAEKAKANKEYWDKYNNNASFRKMIDEKWRRLYRMMGVKVLRARGVPEHVIKKMLKEVKDNG